ncbi:MAG TPA: gluconate 2-dehydrogenase subunit 3 family protein [Steroidobacteraceae bacterium]
MTDSLYPGYDVLQKRDGQSWNSASRRTLDARLSLRQAPRFFAQAEWFTVRALCERIMPQPTGSQVVPLAALLDQRLLSGRTDGFRRANLPQQAEAWRQGLAAIDVEARTHHGMAFHELDPEQQDALLRRLQAGELTGAAWRGMPGQDFFAHRVLPDITSAYYAHPLAWNEIGFGGPASPRGYVRMDFNRRDPWEAAEALPGNEVQALSENRRVR